MGALRLGASGASYQASGTGTFSQPSWQPAAPPRTAAATLGNTRPLKRSHALERLEKLLPSLHSLLCVCPRADQAAGDQLQEGQGGSKEPAGAQGLRVCTFLYSSSSPSCSCQVSSSCHEEEPQRQGSEKTGFYSSCAAHSHSLETLSCQSYYETNQVPDSGLALPHPQESQHCTKLYLQGKQSEMASPKNPLAIQKKTFKTSVTVTPSTQPASHWLLPGLA